MNTTDKIESTICQRHRNQFMLTASGELTLQQTVESRNHLQNCPDCRRWSEDYAALTAPMLQLIAVPTPPSRVIENILARAQPPSRRMVILTMLLRPALAAAAAILVVAGIWFGTTTARDTALARQGQRAQELHALATLLSDQGDEIADSTSNVHGDDSIRALAHQLLILQGIESKETAEDDGLTPNAGLYPTTPRGHNIPSFHATSRV